MEQLRGLALTLVLALGSGACAVTHQVSHVSPAESQPGSVGFSVTEHRTSVSSVQVRRWSAGAAAMTPPVPHVNPRDVVWRATTRGHTLELCRPTTQGRHRCQVVPLPDGVPGVPIIFIDKMNLGRQLQEVTSMSETNAVGAIHTRGTQGAPMTPHYGVWVSSSAGTVHCRVRNNQPECQKAPMPALPSAGLIFAGGMPLTVEVVQLGGELRDVLWVARIFESGFVRCEAGGSGEPKCELAKMLP
jgi:hypothetical protein